MGHRCRGRCSRWLTVNVIWKHNLAFNIILRRCRRMIWPQGSTCERLEWGDVPNGQLRDHSGRLYQHEESRCLESTLRFVFRRAWISAQRRQRRASKPSQLETSKTYIRVDEKVLKAFMLIAHERYSSDYEEAKVVHFKEFDGVMTGHLMVKSAHSLFDARKAR